MAELVITDRNYRQFTGDGKVASWGGDDRLLTCQPRESSYGDLAWARPVVEAVPLIPRGEWENRIRDLTEARAWLYDTVIHDKIACMDQDGLGFCWSYGTTHGVMALRASQHLPYIPLLPEALGHLVGWQNQGNTVDGTMRGIMQHGICAARFTDRAHSLNYRNWKPGWQEDRENHKLLECYDMDVPGKIWDAAMTWTLLGFPFSAGYGWWGHLVTGGYKARKTANGWEILFRNSWGKSFGEDGWFWMPEGRGTPDIGCFALRQVTAATA